MFSQSTRHNLRNSHTQVVDVDADDLPDDIPDEVADELRGAQTETQRQVRAQAADGGEGSVGVVRVNGVVIPVSFVEAYAYRPLIFCDYSLYEFFCVCELVRRLVDDETAPAKQQRRVASSRTDLHSDCSISATHCVRLRSKQLVPKLHPSPPRMPQPNSRAQKPRAWATQAHAFAVYALVLWRPWNIATHRPDTLNWKAFCDFVDQCRNGTFVTPGRAHDGSNHIGRFLGGVRLQWMLTSAQFLTAPGPLRSAVMTRRARDADPWSDMAKARDEALLNRGVRKPGTGPAEDREALTPEELQRAMASLAMLQRQQLGVSDHDASAHAKKLASATHLSDALTHACSLPVTDAEQPDAVVTEPRRARPVSLDKTGHGVTNVRATEEHILQKLAALKGGDPTSEPGSELRPVMKLHGPLEAFQPSDTLAAAVGKLNAEQRPIYDRCAAAAAAFSAWVFHGAEGDPPPPLLLFIHGGPGVGKSFLISTIRLLTYEMGLYDITVAPFASAANIIKGRTYHGATGQSGKSRFDTPPSKRLLAALAAMHNIGLCWAVIGDETSAVSPALFDCADSRIGLMAKRPHLRWGGLSVLMFGDFFQLPPVPPLSLFDVVVSLHVFKAADMPPAHRRAAEFFVTLRKVELVHNMRAKDDKFWATVLRRIRDATPGRRPLADVLLPLLEQMILTQGDVLDDPEFRHAVVLLSGNYERAHIIAARVRALARSLGVAVVRWRLKLSGPVAAALTPQQTEDIYRENPLLWGYFVKYAEAFLAENVKALREVRSVRQ